MPTDKNSEENPVPVTVPPVSTDPKTGGGGGGSQTNGTYDPHTPPSN
ncbi:hypothetical protein [Amycolatopsis sp. NPDC058986]